MVLQSDPKTITAAGLLDLLIQPGLDDGNGVRLHD
jgi:hypothetical protein